MSAPDRADVVIIGAGAAGLMAAIWAGRSAPPDRRIILLDGAAHVGAKILVAGGGRCNVTHDVVDETAFAGSSRNAIKKVLRRFDVEATIEFFRALGVELKREETGKLFPVTDRARTVLEALLAGAAAAGARLQHPWRVESVEPAPEGGFQVCGPAGVIAAPRVVLATGGRSLPRSGSDGHGYTIAQSLGHSVTSRVFPALVPLTIAKGAHFIPELSGLSAPATIAVRATTGRKLAEFTGPVLCTHFGLSGPAILDISRYYTDAKMDDPGAWLTLNWLPGETFESVEAALLESGAATVGRWMKERVPERLAAAIVASLGIDGGAPVRGISRDARRELARALVEMRVPITGDRGFTYAEVTAGGVPLSGLRLETMESRLRPGLFLCGEICDVDGRIGGYNFQWAWSSGYTVGVSV